MQTYAFPATVSARKIQREYKKIFESVKETKQPVVVVANNTPQAAIISLEMLAEYKKLQVERMLFKTIDRIQAKNADKDEQAVFKDVTADVEETRQKLYEQTFGGR